MVLLREVTPDGVWGLVIEPNKTYQTVVEKNFRLTMACLDIDSLTPANALTHDLTRLMTKATTLGQETSNFVLANLHVPMHLQQQLDLEFTQGQTVCFTVNGPHKVHLSGYILPSEPQELCEEGCDHEHAHPHSHSHHGSARAFFERMAEEGEEEEHTSDDYEEEEEEEEDSENSDEEEEGSYDEEEEEERQHRIPPSVRFRLKEDQDQDLAGDYEDGFLEGEGDTPTTTDTSDDEDEDVTLPMHIVLGKGNKRLREKSEKKKKSIEKQSNVTNGHGMNGTTTGTDESSNDKSQQKEQEESSSPSKKEKKKKNKNKKRKLNESEQESTNTTNEQDTATAPTTAEGADTEAGQQEEAPSDHKEEMANGTEATSNGTTKSKKSKSKKKKREEEAAAAAASATDGGEGDATTIETKLLESQQPQPPVKKQTAKKGRLEVTDIRVGTGPEATLGKTAGIYYTGHLLSDDTPIDSLTSGKTKKFKLGAGEVIPGWEQGIKGMKVGGKRKLVIPPGLAYGNKSEGNIPPSSTLVYEIELKNVY